MDSLASLVLPALASVSWKVLAWRKRSLNCDSERTTLPGDPRSRSPALARWDMFLEVARTEVETGGADFSPRMAGAKANVPDGTLAGGTVLPAWKFSGMGQACRSSQDKC